MLHKNMKNKNITELNLLAIRDSWQSSLFFNCTCDKISEELIKIHYRLQYNDTIWFGPSVRAYSFHNCINSRLF